MNVDKNLVIAAVIGTVLLCAGAYLLFFKPPGSVVTETAPASPEEIAFVNLASQLEPLTFDTSIFSDPRFLALINIHTDIIPEQGGRRDPFAPLGK